MFSKYYQRSNFIIFYSGRLKLFKELRDTFHLCAPRPSNQSWWSYSPMTRGRSEGFLRGSRLEPFSRTPDMTRVTREPSEANQAKMQNTKSEKTKGPGTWSSPTKRSDGTKDDNNREHSRRKQTDDCRITVVVEQLLSVPACVGRDNDTMCGPRDQTT